MTKYQVLALPCDGDTERHGETRIIATFNTPEEAHACVLARSNASDPMDYVVRPVLEECKMKVYILTAVIHDGHYGPLDSIIAVYASREAAQAEMEKLIARLPELVPGMTLERARNEYSIREMEVVE